MAISLDENQERIVASKRLPDSQKPSYYNAGVKRKVQISDDFEAYLILQGRQKNKDTLDWLKKSSDFAVQDSDRDSLVNSMIENEVNDALIAQTELTPVIAQFSKFRTQFQLKGFEGVAETGQLLADLQRPMGEIIALNSRHDYRQRAGNVLRDLLSRGGLTSDQQKQLNSWFEPLTAY